MFLVQTGTEMGSSLNKFLFRNGQKRNSPRWAFMEGFRVPHSDRPEEDYLWRIRLVATPWFGIFLHKICTPDPRQVLHNHPWSFVSIVLRGGYYEFVPCDCGFDHCQFYAVRNHVSRINVKRFAKSFHWIDSLDRTPTWTLVFTGRRRCVWGYLEEDGKFTEFNKHPFNDQFQLAMEQRYGGGDAI